MNLSSDSVNSINAIIFFRVSVRNILHVSNFNKLLFDTSWQWGGEVFGSMTVVAGVGVRSDMAVSLSYPLYIALYDYFISSISSFSVKFCSSVMILSPVALKSTGDQGLCLVVLSLRVE